MISWQTRTSTSVPIQAILNYSKYLPHRYQIRPVSNQEVPSISIPPEIRTCSSGSLSSTKGKGQVLSQNNDDMDVDDDDPSGDNFSRGRVVTGEVASFLFLFFLSFDDLFFTQHRRKL